MRITRGESRLTQLREAFCDTCYVTRDAFFVSYHVARYAYYERRKPINPTQGSISWYFLLLLRITIYESRQRRTVNVF